MPFGGAGVMAVVVAALLAGCASTMRQDEPPALPPDQARSLALKVIPASVSDRAGWATDVYAALATQDIPASAQNVCAVLAVTEQESTYRANPSVPNLAKIAREEIDERASRAGVPAFAVSAALRLSSPDGRSYAERLEKVTTEGELSEIFEDFIDMVPLGRTFLASRNPIRTGGPMQVSIAFAEAQVDRRPYPYPVKDSIRHEVFTRRGGLYFGAGHLFDYQAPYDDLVFRFADFNAGRWASRNAALQNAVSVVSGVPLVLDGDLLLPSTGADRRQGQTELAVNAMASRLDMGTNAIHDDLARGNEPGLEDTRLWKRIFELGDQRQGRPLPRAVIPRITLESPKITRRLTTEWFARRVEERWKRCMAKAPTPPATAKDAAAGN